MDKIKKEVNDCNKDMIKELTNIYNKLSDSLDKSYLYGQKSGFEEILVWLRHPQNKSTKYISPKSIKNYLIEKGAKTKIVLNEKSRNFNNLNNLNCIKEDIKKKANKTNFNYLYYNQTFNIDNNKNNNEKNVFPISVETAFDDNTNSNRINNPFNSILFNNNHFLKEQNNNIAILSNPYTNYNFSNTMDIINNNMNDSKDRQIKTNSPLRNNNFFGNINLKRKKNF